MILVNPTMPENRTDVSHQTSTDHGLHNSVLYVNIKMKTVILSLQVYITYN